MIDHERKFIFIHVPRTGGHSAYRMLGYKRRPGGPIHRPLFDVMYKTKEPYFSFGFVRNPWARMYSCYRRQLEFPEVKSKSFKHYLFYVLRDNTLLNPAMWYLDGCMFIGQYEKLQEGWDFIFPKIDIPQQEIPWVNKCVDDDDDYRNHYDTEMVDFIAVNHAKDIEFGGYNFE